MRRILLVMSVAVLMVAMIVAMAAPAMAFNTFQFPVEQDGVVVVPVEEPPGPPTASGGPRNFVFHCEDGGTEIVHTDAQGEEIKRLGKGECAPI